MPPGFFSTYGRATHAAPIDSSCPVCRRRVAVQQRTAATEKAKAATLATGRQPGQGECADAPVKLVDINSASRQELKTLPGIGDAEADRIIADRPYLSKTELVSQGVLPVGPYVSLKDRVVAKPEGPSAETQAVAKPSRTVASTADRSIPNQTNGQTSMNITRPILCALLLLAGLAWQPTVLAQRRARRPPAPRPRRPAHRPRRRCPSPTSTAPRAPTPASAATTTRAPPTRPRRSSRPSTATAATSARRSAPTACSARPATGPARCMPAPRRQRRSTPSSPIRRSRSRSATRSA